MKRLNRVKTEWSPEFAYAIGLLVTDGSLSKDGRHINFSSMDLPCLGRKHLKIQEYLRRIGQQLALHARVAKLADALP